MSALAASGAIQAEVVLSPMRAAPKRGPNLIPNPGFEAIKDGRPAGLRSQLSPDYVVDTQVVHSGKRSLKFVKPTGDTKYWVSFHVQLNQKEPVPLVVSGWSRADSVSGKRGSNYSVWVDLAYMDGTPLWGQQARFDTGTHDWQHSEHSFFVAKPVRSATVNILFRGSYTGTVWFDDVSLQELRIEGASFFDQSSVIRSAQAQKPGQVAGRLKTGDGLGIGLDGRGLVAELAAGRENLLGEAPGGFVVRDAAAGGDWVRLQGRVTTEPSALRFEAEEASLGLALAAKFQAHDDRLSCAASVKDLTGADRAITLYFLLPVRKAGWTWHDDIVRSQLAKAQSEYANTSGWLTGLRSSIYPLSSITSDATGLSMCVRMDAPRVSRFAYNAGLGLLYVAVDLGLTKETLKFPSRADFGFSMYLHEPQWGFRAALAKYYRLFPEFFTQRIREGGIWMAFSDISKVAGFQDFGFKFKEGTRETKWDDEHGIHTFSYIEPMAYWLSMAQKYPRSYEGAMQALRDNERSKKWGLFAFAQAVRRCCAYTRDGRLDMDIRNRSWCNGAVFTLNPDPDLPEDKACPINKAHLGYSKKWGDKNLCDRPTGRLDGVYLDSMPNWGSVRNFRREHWRTVDVPLTFDPETKQPVLTQIFSTWEFAKFVADDVHARGGLMHGNGGALWPYFPALLDVTGQETGSILSDSSMAQARSLLYHKPYSPLLNTRFDKLGSETMVEYFNCSLLYGIFPSMFNGTYMKDGKWVQVHYFKEPTFYERDRALFKKYIPILRRLFDAGWEAVTHARVSATSIRVERYGPSATGEVLFALYSPAKAEAAAQLHIQAKPLGLPEDVCATELVANAKLPCRTLGDQLVVSCAVPARKCRVVCIAQRRR